MGFQSRQSKSQGFNLLIQEPAILEQNQFFLQGRKKLKKSVKIEETSKQREHLVKHFTNFIH